MKKAGLARLVHHAWIIVILLILCSCWSWSRNNSQLTFVEQVADRIEACNGPVYLTDQEIYELEESLGGPVEDMFLDSELSDDVVAYYEETTKGINKDNVVFYRHKKNKQRHVFIVYTRAGNLFAAGGALEAKCSLLNRLKKCSKGSGSDQTNPLPQQ